MNKSFEVNSNINSLTPSSNLNSNHTVLLISDVCINEIRQILDKYKLELRILDKNQQICGSYWGDSEAGLIKNIVYVREDTPVHSLFHEACHYVCMDEKRRNQLDTNAEGDYEEENAVCYLQILLANKIPRFSSQRMMADMDTWGYTFRLGSAQAWFEEDAEDALTWLQDKKLLDINKQPNFKLRIN